MGIDLDWAPVVRELRGEAWCSSLLSVARDYSLFDAIRAIPPEPIGMEVHGYGLRPAAGYGYGGSLVDHYEEPLTYVRAGDLAAVLKSFDQPYHRANIAYISALEPSTKIVLLWG